MSLVKVYGTEFVLRSLMAWGKKLFLSLSVFAIINAYKRTKAPSSSTCTPALLIDSLPVLSERRYPHAAHCAQ